MYHREELGAHTSRGSRGSRNNDWEDHERSERAAAADYERNRCHENQLRRDEEAKQQRQQELEVTQNQRAHNAANNA